jgi:hypothetical protein
VGSNNLSSLTPLKHSDLLLCKLPVAGAIFFHYRERATGESLGLALVGLIEDTNAMDHPSGDHAGQSLRSPTSVSLVSGMGADPSAFMTRILTVLVAVSLPSRESFEEKLSRDPSGDQLKLLQVTFLNRVSGRLPEPSAFDAQIFIPPAPASLPSGARLDI